MAFDIAGKVVFISGGAGDIGATIVAGFVRENCRVMIGDLNLAAAEAIKAAHPNADISVCQVNIADSDSVKAAAESVEKQYGRLDVLVNGAGILCRKSVMEAEQVDFEQSMGVNVIGTFMLSKAMVPLLSKAKGTIIGISSLNGTAAVENRVVYGATKAALNMVMQSMALELAEKEITVNVVSPGVVDSKMCRVRLDTQEKIDAFCRYIPQGRLTTPEDVCGSVMFLSSGYARGITGEIILVDGGITARQALPR